MAKRRKPTASGTSRGDSLVSKQAEGQATSEEPIPSTTGPVVSDPATQYVAGDRRYPFLRGDIIGLGSVDEAEEAFGWEIWREILTDATAQSLRLWIKVNTTVDGFTIGARRIEPKAGADEPPKDDTDNADWARRYCQHITDRLAMVDRPMLATIWNLLDGAIYPYKLAEPTYETLKGGDFAGHPGFKCIRTKPRDNFELVYDEMHAFRGVIAKVPGGSQALWTGIVIDSSKVPNCIAEEKVMLFYVTDEDGEPRSLWSGVYAPWARLQETYAEVMAAEGAMAGGKVSTEVPIDQRGQQFTNPKTGASETAMEQTEDSAGKWRNNGVFITLGNSQTKVWFPPGDVLDGFLKMIRQSQREMCMAITIDAKAILEGEHASGLSEDKSSDNADPVIALIQQRVCWMLERLYYYAVKLARGLEFAQKYAPVVSMGRSAEVDFADNGLTYASIYTARAVLPSKLGEYHDKLGLKRPTTEEIAAYTELWKTWNELATNPPEPAAIPAASAKPEPKPSK